MRAVGFCTAALLVCAACAGGGERSGIGAPSRLDKEYPRAFSQLSAAAEGVGFLPQGRRGDPVLDPAVDTARRHLGWNLRVRVRGERLFERTDVGGQVFRGENIELLEVPELSADECRLDTLAADGHVWVFARQNQARPAGGAVPWGTAPPLWIEHLPQERGWRYATGSAPISYRDEPGSWDLATYHALVELAFSVGTRTGQLQRNFEGVLLDANVQSVDTRLEGFRVAGRWRDRDHAYVLARVPVGGAVSLLGK